MKFMTVGLNLLLALGLTAAVANDLDFSQSTAGISRQQGQYYAEAWQRRINSHQSQPDLSVQQYLQQLSDDLAQGGQLNLGQLKVSLIRSNQFNAFAGLGQFMGVHQGLLLHLDSEDALASILAHEMGHMQARHIERMIERQRQLGNASLASLISGLVVMSTVDPQAGMAIVLSGQAAAIEGMLAFSRSNETEADSIARAVLKANQRPEDAFNLAIRNLARQQQLLGSPPAWLNSHPLAQERLASGLTLAPSQQAKSNDRQFWYARTRLSPSRTLASEQAPAYAQTFATLLQDAASDPQKAYEKMLTLQEEYPAPLLLHSIAELSCQHGLASCLERSQAILRIDPDQLGVRLALVQKLMSDQDFEQAWSLVQRAPSSAHQLPNYWLIRSQLLNHFQQHVAASRAQAQYLWWSGKEVESLAYLEAQSRRLGDASISQLLTDKRWLFENYHFR